MESRSRLDYALFQLTPTRTRCELVICAGDRKEKLASGLLQPFLTHLTFAKDQISKGGYSIMLSAPVSASWFTKSTLERFVRFVSTPEVLERFIAIEREIVNIDCSINTNASSDSQTVYGFGEQSNKYKHEWNTSDAVHEEDSKVHLQRVLENRKAVLQKEQAMVYARALVAGFETVNLEDLICFSDAFGSPRLREACLNFMELCNTKSNDRVWMDEVAAMRAYSHSQYSYMGTSGGIMLPGGEDEPSQECRINNVHNGNFANQKPNGAVDCTVSDSIISQGSNYMHAYQSDPMFPPIYQGYPFQGTMVPPYFQGNLPWPPHVEDFRSRGKRSQKNGGRGSKQDRNLDSSDSSFGSDSSSYRSSSRKVVIRNINYITSEKDVETEHESDHNSSNGVVNQDLDRTVKDKCEVQHVTQQWNIFQNLLMKDADEKEFEEVKNPHNSFSENKNQVRNLQPGEDLSPIIKKHNTSKDEFVSHRFEEPDINPSRTRPELATESYWVSGRRPDKVIEEKSRDIFEDHFHTTESTKDVLVDDPLAVQARSLYKSSDSQLRTQDIVMVSEGNIIQKVPYSPNKKIEATCANEPDDLFMVLERDTAMQQAVANWTPEMESRNSKDNIIKHDSVEDKKLQIHGKEPKSRPKASVGQNRERKGSTIEAKSKVLAGSIGKSKSDIVSRKKIYTGTKETIPKGKSQKEEEKRKKMEELLTQRQKRIAERTQRSASTTKTVKSKDPKSQLASRDMKKPVIKSSTIDRLSAPRVVNHKAIPTDTKPGNKPMKGTTKKNGEAKHVNKPKKAPIREDGQAKPGKNPTKVTTRKNGVSHAEKKEGKPDNVKHLAKNIGSKNSNGMKKKIADLKNVNQLSKKPSDNGVARNRLSAPPNHQSKQSENTKGLNETLHKASAVLQNDKALYDNNGGSAKKASNSVSFRINEDNCAKGNHVVKVNHETPMMGASTPPPGKRSPERSNSRKKWSSAEASTKALSSFKKLLSFGRKS